MILPMPCKSPLKGVRFCAIALVLVLLFGREATGVIPSSHRSLPLSLSGEIQDIRLTITGKRYTNTLSFTGFWVGDKYLLDVVPIKTEDEIAESAGWDGNTLRIIQRYPSEPGKRRPRDQALARVEPSIFSHYATPATTALLLALASKESLDYLQSRQEPIIYGGERLFPEEDNSYEVQYDATGGVTATAVTPGRHFVGGSEQALAEFKDGFTRWSFSCKPTKVDSGSSSAGAAHLSIDYKRFFPDGGKVFMFRHVTAQMIVTSIPQEQLITDFRPPIAEASIRVSDHSSRRELFSLLKGITDYEYRYTLTNRDWNFDQSALKRAVDQVKINLGKGLPREYLPTSKPDLSTGRATTISLLAIISVGFSFLFWRMWQETRTKPESLKPNKKEP